MEFKNINPDLILRTLRRKGLRESEERKSLTDKWIETIERINDGDEKLYQKLYSISKILVTSYPQ